jgi:arginine deiminase
MPTISELLANGTIEQVAADTNAAEAELGMARSHLDAVAAVIDTDSIVAYTALYDGVRKAISAHVRANGYRAPKGPGNHMRILAYAEAVLSGKDLDTELGQLDRLRSQRNRTEYGVAFVSKAQVEADLPIATAVVEALGRDLGI